MRRLSILTAVLLCAAPFVAGAAADDAEEVRAAERAHNAAINAEDADALAKLHLPENSGFSANGGLLAERRPMGPFAEGVDFDFRLRHLQVEVYGDAAVATSYRVGTVTSPDGTTQRVNDRVTHVWVKRGGEWKEAHSHSSRLTVPAAQ